MACQKLSINEIPIARGAEAIGRGPGPWKEAPDPKNRVGGMAKRLGIALDPPKEPVGISADLPWTPKKN